MRSATESEPLVGQCLHFDGPKVLDLKLMFPAPPDEGGFGDIQLGHEPGVGPPLGAEFDETLNGFLVVHIGPSPDRILKPGERLKAGRRNQTGNLFVVSPNPSAEPDGYRSQPRRAKVRVRLTPFSTGEGPKKLWKQPHGPTCEHRPQIP